MISTTLKETMVAFEKNNIQKKTISSEKKILQREKKHCTFICSHL